MKKIISLLSALILAAGSCAAVSAKEVQMRPNGTVKLSPWDVVIMKRNGSTETRFAGFKLAVVDTEPTEEEMISHPNIRYLVDCEDPYLMYYDITNDRSQMVKEDFDLNISYIVDLDENKVYDYETIFPLKKINFENHEVWAPNEPEKVLKSIYGNYMSIPKNSYPRHSSYVNIPTQEQNLLEELSQWKEL